MSDMYGVSRKRLVGETGFWIVLVSGVENGSCFVLASFDPTTLESYISTEFTS